ncbi:phosphoglucomutase/phosphomannomutase family protein [Crocosphaera watsonii WH 0402]|uniref:Phosphoglucomutase/phosphomannomutase family protein n=1 Tax=Crocosphaera watsonii WH 0402 TaxID=1284629 RepID=T2JKT2_CROWT|nr:phosphoglucomutase/phosphomannomutase family protein [Crocosphaera watsonii WH 0402]
MVREKLGKSASKLIISLGRDSRLSGPDLLAAASEGISLLGSTVYNFEIASTPAMFMSTINPDLSCDGAIMLTASHLPFNRNGLKFFTKNGGLNKGDITEILNLAENNNFPVGTEKGNIKDYDFISVYSEGLVKKIREGVNHTENFEQPLKGLKIIVDAGNGAGGFYAEKVLKPLGADTEGSQFLDPDGTFPIIFLILKMKKPWNLSVEQLLIIKQTLGLFLIRM